MIAICVGVTTLQGWYDPFPVSCVTPATAISISVTDRKCSVLGAAIKKQLFLFGCQLGPRLVHGNIELFTGSSQ